jgi:FMN-dependent NADH-azoreductase
MRILHLDSSLLGSKSVSRSISSEIVARLVTLNPETSIIYRDLADDPALHLLGAHLGTRRGVAALEKTLLDDLLKGNAYMDELFQADIVVIGAPMYNLSIPTPLKAWIDRVAVAGRTYCYTANGPEGLLKNKRVFIASARGAAYSAGNAAAALEHHENYLIGLLGFLGIHDTTVIRAEGIAFSPQAKTEAIVQARKSIAAITG